MPIDTTAFDYADDTNPLPPTHESTERVVNLVKLAVDAEKELEDLTAKVAAKQAYYNSLIEEQLPAAMDAMGMSSFTTNTGYQISVREEMTHSLAAERKDSGYDWLEQNGQGSVIKREVAVAFAKGQEKQAVELVETIKKVFPSLPVSSTRDVHSSTLKSLLTKMMKDGVNVPVDIFKIRKFKKAIIK